MTSTARIETTFRVHGRNTVNGYKYIDPVNVPALVAEGRVHWQNPQAPDCNNGDGCYYVYATIKGCEYDYCVDPVNGHIIES